MNIGNILDSFIIALGRLRKLSFVKQNISTLSEDFCTVDDTSITNVIANRFSFKVAGSSRIKINWNVSILSIETFIKRFFSVTFRNVINVVLGTGDCLMIPTFDGKKFGVRLVPSRCFSIAKMSGEDIMSAWVLGGSVTNDKGEVYTWKELFSVGIDESGTTFSQVERFAFKGDKQIPLRAYPGFENLDDAELSAFEKTVIPNYDKPLFGRIKCPILNREDLNSPYGVPITYGNQKSVDAVKEAISILNNEMKRKRTKIFFGKQLAKKNDKGETVLPQDGDFMVPLNNGLNEQGKLIDAFAPDTRFEQYKGYVEFTMKTLESMVGISHDTMTEPADTSLVTATAIRVSMYESLALVDIIRKNAEIGVNDLIDAVCVLYNAVKKDNEPLAANHTVSYDWDDTMRENTSEYFQMLLQSKSVGETLDGEIRSWLNNIPLDQAQEELANVKTSAEEDNIAI